MSIKQLVKKLDKNGKIRKTYYKLKETNSRRRFAERKIYNIFGIKQNGTVYIIRRNNSVAGLFSYFQTTLGELAYADKCGFIPVVDYCNYANSYLYKEEIGKINSWEYFFEQPSKLTLHDGLKSKRIILGDGRSIHGMPGPSADLFYNRQGELDYWKSICDKYIKVNPSIKNQVNEAKKIFNGKKVLGVSCRGTDYVALRPHGHPIQPTIEAVMEKIDEVIEEQKYELIYLTVEDKKIIERMQEKYGDKLIMYDRKHADYDPNEIGLITGYDLGQKDDKYRQGFDYLVSMLLLNECDGLITSLTSGSLGVMCMSKGFSYLYVFDMGTYD